MAICSLLPDLILFKSTRDFEEGGKPESLEKNPSGDENQVQQVPI